MKIGVIGAMDEELLPLRAWFQSGETTVRGPRTFFEGAAFGHELFLTRSDPGKVSGALAAQSLVEHFPVDLLINLGSSGALSPELQVGDLVIAQELMQHDFDVTAFGLAPGELLFDLVMNKHTGTPSFRRQRSFFADEALSLQTFHQARVLAEQGAFGLVLSRAPAVHLGRVVSGDQFIGDPARSALLHEQFQALCADMESAAIAQVCALYGTPFVCVRAISDKADHHARLSFGAFLQVATANYGLLFAAVLAHLPGSVAQV